MCRFSLFTQVFLFSAEETVRAGLTHTIRQAHTIMITLHTHTHTHTQEYFFKSNMNKYF